MPPVALIDRVEAAIAGIAHTQAAPANAADQQALQQTKALSGWSREDFAICPVPRQALAVGESGLPAWRSARASVCLRLNLVAVQAQSRRQSHAPIGMPWGP